MIIYPVAYTRGTLYQASLVPSRHISILSLFSPFVSRHGGVVPPDTAVSAVSALLRLRPDFPVLRVRLSQTASSSAYSSWPSSDTGTNSRTKREWFCAWTVLMACMTPGSQPRWPGPDAMPEGIVQKKRRLLTWNEEQRGEEDIQAELGLAAMQLGAGTSAISSTRMCWTHREKGERVRPLTSRRGGIRNKGHTSKLASELLISASHPRLHDSHHFCFGDDRWTHLSLVFLDARLWQRGR